MYNLRGILHHWNAFMLHVRVFCWQADIVVRITFTWSHNSCRSRPVVSTRFTGLLAHLHTVHYVRRCGNKTQTIKRSPWRTRHIFCSLNLHAVYERSQGKQKVERESREESSSCGGVSLFCYGLHMSHGKCSFYPSKALASANEHISLPKWNLPC